MVAILLSTDMPTGFVSIIGEIALAGMIIRNSVILVDQIEHNRAEGQDPWTAVVEAACHRLRPILLTGVSSDSRNVSYRFSRILGTARLHHHGWFSGGDLAYLAIFTGCLCGMVPYSQATAWSFMMFEILKEFHPFALLKSIMPRGLLARSLLILVSPMVISAVGISICFLWNPLGSGDEAPVIRAGGGYHGHCRNDAGLSGDRKSGQYLLHCRINDDHQSTFSSRKRS